MGDETDTWNTGSLHFILSLRHLYPIPNPIPPPDRVPSTPMSSPKVAPLCSRTMSEE